MLFKKKKLEGESLLLSHAFFIPLHGDNYPKASGHCSCVGCFFFPFLLYLHICVNNMVLFVVNFNKIVTLHPYCLETCFISVMFLRLINISVCINRCLFCISSLDTTISGFICRDLIWILWEAQRKGVGFEA